MSLNETRDYSATDAEKSICTKCGLGTVAYVYQGEVISACCYAPAKWTRTSEIIEPNDLYCHVE